MTEDRDLSFHMDQSDVTLNLCLGKVWTGAALAILLVPVPKRSGVGLPTRRAVEMGSIGISSSEVFMHVGSGPHGGISNNE